MANLLKIWGTPWFLTMPCGSFTAGIGSFGFPTMPCDPFYLRFTDTLVPYHASFTRGIGKLGFLTMHCDSFTLGIRTPWFLTMPCGPFALSIMTQWFLSSQLAHFAKYLETLVPYHALRLMYSAVIRTPWFRTMLCGTFSLFGHLGSLPYLAAHLLLVLEYLGS